MQQHFLASADLCEYISNEMKCTHHISISEIATAGILFLMVSATKAFDKV
jgi:hypothetical protein